MHLIDGDNLVHAARAAGAGGGAIGREALCALVGAWAKRTGRPVCLVFDGAPPAEAFLSQMATAAGASVKVRFSGGGVSADLRIFELLENSISPRTIVVVSSDGDVRRESSRWGAAAIRSEEFWLALVTAMGMRSGATRSGPGTVGREGQGAARKSRDGSVASGGPDRRSDSDAACDDRSSAAGELSAVDWLREFGLDADDAESMDRLDLREAGGSAARLRGRGDPAQGDAVRGQSNREAPDTIHEQSSGSAADGDAYRAPLAGGQGAGPEHAPEHLSAPSENESEWGIDDDAWPPPDTRPLK
ncbi:MAG: NYN domain-containing protein [Planctomycetia bacterium]|nr:MAG: NYN domain-containing protein [Planctomycetia bacterium]